MTTLSRLIETTPDQVQKFYASIDDKLKAVKKKLNRDALTLAEKILFSHLDNLEQELVRGQSFVNLRPDRVVMQDATAQNGASPIHAIGSIAHGRTVYRSL